MAIKKTIKKASSKRSKKANPSQGIIRGKLESQLHPTALKIARVNRGLSQQDAAKEFSISLPSYSAIERGHRLVRKDRAEAIARFFNADFKFMFNPSDKKNKFLANA